MNTFFPVPTSNMGNSATPAPIDPATGQAISFTQVLMQTQAQLNPLMLAMLNGMAGLSPQTDVTTTIPTINAEITTEMPGQEIAPATPDTNLLMLAGLCMTPIVMPNAASNIVPTNAPLPTQITSSGNESVPNSSQTTIAVPSVDLTAGQQTLLSGAEDIAALVSQLQAAQMTQIEQAVPQTGQTPDATLPTLPDMRSAAAQAAPPIPTPQSTTPILANAGQTTTNGSSFAQIPSRQPEVEPTLTRNVLAVVAEPIFSGQNAQKPILALPMDTERAIALPNMAVAPITSGNPTDTDASTDSDSHKTETFAAIAQPVGSTIQPTGTQTFGDTLQRLEATGRTTAANAEAVKPSPTDRYEVAAQVTKHLETLTGAGGRSEMIVQLKPEHLGQIKITISTSENGLSAKIVSDSVQAQTALNGAKESLRSAFEQRGLTLETLDVTLNQQAFGNGQQTFAEMQQGYGQPQTHQMRTFTGSFLPEDELEISATSAAVPARNSLNRLDFRA